MKKKTFIAVVLSIISVAVFGQEKIKDVRTNPTLYFLQIEDVARSLDLLAPPPQPGSILFLYDQAQYQWGKMQRNTPRGEQAFSDANVDGDGVPQAFSEAFGVRISKEHYMRMRPFAFYQEETCNPKQQQELSTNGSYPSGHTAIGWATALVLAEINVDRQNEILKRGYEMGQSRVICGYHFQSDVDAARLVASAVVARLHANENFMVQLGKAKQEFAALVKEGKVKKSETQVN